MKKSEKPKRKVSNVMLVIIVIMIITFTLGCFAMQYVTGTEISGALITAWFAFWGTEIIALTAIKTSKLKHSKDGETLGDPEEDSATEEEEIDG